MARKTRAERLGSQGIAFVEVDGLLARLTKQQSADPGRFVRAVQAVAVGVPVALHIRTRVRDERRLAEGVWGGYGRSQTQIVTQAYKDAAGLDSRYYQSNAALHAALPNPSKLFHVTGAMWDGLQVRGSGRSKAVLDFTGTSIGKGARKVTRTRRGRTVVKSVPQTVRNSAKAFGIFAAKGINVLQPSQTENIAMADAVSQVVGVQMAVAFDADRLSMSTLGEQSLVESIKRSLSA